MKTLRFSEIEWLDQAYKTNSGMAGHKNKIYSEATDSISQNPVFKNKVTAKKNTFLPAALHQKHLFQ